MTPFCLLQAAVLRMNTYANAPSSDLHFECPRPMDVNQFPIIHPVYRFPIYNLPFVMNQPISSVPMNMLYNAQAPSSTILSNNRELQYLPSPFLFRYAYGLPHLQTDNSHQTYETMPSPIMNVNLNSSQIYNENLKPFLLNMSPNMVLTNTSTIFPLNGIPQTLDNMFLSNLYPCIQSGELYFGFQIFTY